MTAPLVASRYCRPTLLALVLCTPLASPNRSPAAERPATRQATAPATAPATLSADNAKALDQLFTDGLFDPTGHPFVRFHVGVRSVWNAENAREVEVSGWLVEPAGPDPEPLRWAVLISGEAAPVVGATTPDDFLARCAEIINRADARTPATRPAKPESDGPPDFDTINARMDEIRVQRPGETAPRRFLAAWLHRLGHDNHAARMLARAATAKPKAADGDPAGDSADAVPLHLDAWHWFGAGVHAYMVRADAEALFYLRRLAAYFPDALKEAANEQDERRRPQYPQAAELLAELNRRRKEGTFGKPAPEAPADFASWPVERRVAYLVGQLEEVDARQWGQPGGVDLAGDRSVTALIEIGDSAVPALIDCVEKDRRLTRSVHFWRDFAPSRTVLGVREAALTAVMTILHTSVFEPAATGDNFTARGEDQAAETAKKLRAYWKTYGHLPFDARMMAILTDPKLKPEAWREAAENLAGFGEQRTLGTTVFVGSAQRRAPGALNPVVGKFKSPTAAEAILAAMERDLDRHDRGEHDNLFEYRRRQIEAQYVDALTHLGDGAIVPALLERLKAPPTPRVRRMLATACFALQDPRPLTEFAADVAAGRITLPAGGEANRNDDDQPDAVELKGIVAALASASVKLPAADAALWAIAVPTHPFHDLAARNVRRAGRTFNGQAWLAHPFAIAVLRHDLDDVRPTGATIVIERDKDRDLLTERTGGSSWSDSVPEPLANPATRRDRAEQRACDRAAEQLSGMILGAPYYHPLLNDADERLGKLKAFVDVRLTHLREASSLEAEALARSGMQVHYVLNVRRLTTGATSDDVVAGRAIFHLGGKGTPLDLKLPATAALRRDLPPANTQPTRADVAAGRAREGWSPDPNDKKNHGHAVIEWYVPRVLVLQAERAPDGKTHYGIVTREEIRHVTEDELGDVKPLQSE